MKYAKIQDLTVGQYQDLYAIHKSEDDDFEKVIASVSILTSKPRWEVEEIEIGQFTKISKEIAILFSNQEIKNRVVKKVSVKGKKYAVILNPRKLTAGQYIDLQHFLKQDNLVANMHSLFACLLIPIKYSPLNIKGKYNGADHAEISDSIKSCKFSDINNTCLFFCTLWNNSIKAIEDQLNKQMIGVMKNKNLKSHLSEMDLQKILDGFSMPSVSQILKT